MCDEDIEFSSFEEFEKLKEKLPLKVLKGLEKKAERSWINATLSNYIVFNCFMNNEKICEALLKIMLKTFKLKFGKLSIVYERSIQGKEKDIRLDVYVEDEKHIFDIEMQGKIELMPPERIRDYQVGIDKDQLQKGADYEELKDTFIIIICTRDPFDLGEPVYEIKKRAVSLNIPKFKDGEFNILDYAENDFDLEKLQKNYEDIPNKLRKPRKNNNKRKSVKFEDGTHIIFLNASAYDKVENDELRTFLAYLMGIHLTDCDFYYIIHERYKKIKLTKEVELSYMQTYYKDYYRNLEFRENMVLDLREEVIEDLREEVIDKNNKKIVLNMLSDLTDEQIAKFVKLPIEEIAKIREENS